MAINKFPRKYKYYEILQVSKTATQEEIKRAYLKLAKTYHPDVNPTPEAQEKFKKINEAYEVLREFTRRAAYDNAPAECPLCGTDEVVQTTENQWRCRHDGCKFDTSRVIEVIEQVERAALPEKYKGIIRLFETTQCSWCKKFYTQPFLCPYGRLQSSCVPFTALSEAERKSLLGDEFWWWRMHDMLQRVQETGILAKCREPSCFTLNPNPQETTCWKCGKDTLRCPGSECEAKPILIYHIGEDYWKCPSSSHGKKYDFRVKPNPNPITRLERNLTNESCPKCGGPLFYEPISQLYKCNNGHVFTNNGVAGHPSFTPFGESKPEQPRPKPAPQPSKKGNKWGTSIVVIFTIIAIIFIFRDCGFFRPSPTPLPSPPPPVVKTVTPTPTPTYFYDKSKLQYDRMNEPYFEFSVQYPKKWNWGDVINLSNREMQIRFNGKASEYSAGNSEILVRYCVNSSYQEWLDALTSSNSVNKLENKDKKQGEITYSTFVQSAGNQFSRIYLCNIKAGVLMFSHTYFEKNTLQIDKELLDIYALQMMDSHRVVPKPLAAPSPTPAAIVKPTPTVSPTPTLTVSPKPSSTPTPAISPSVTPKADIYTTSKVMIKGAQLVGADWAPILLTNNSNAKNPSWSQLLTFLKNDNTDNIKYDLNKFVCADFAEMLHNNAEIAGWRCAYVSINLTGYSDFARLGIPSNVGHALNAFETTDRGMIYIDCTGSSSSYGPSNNDTIVDLKVGKEYVPESIFPDPGWSSKWNSMGTVTETDGFQW